MSVRIRHLSAALAAVVVGAFTTLGHVPAANASSETTGNLSVSKQDGDKVFLTFTWPTNEVQVFDGERLETIIFNPNRGFSTTWVVEHLTPGRHVLTLRNAYRGSDGRLVVSEQSNPVTVTIPDRADTTPPSPPQNVVAYEDPGNCGWDFSLDPSTDDETSQPEIEYDAIAHDLKTDMDYVLAYSFFTYQVREGQPTLASIVRDDVSIGANPPVGVRAADAAGNVSAVGPARVVRFGQS